MEKIIDITASFIPSLLQVGASLGVDPVLMQSYIDRLDLDSLERETATHIEIIGLIDLIRVESDDDCLAFKLGQEFSFAYNPDVQTFFRTAQSLRELSQNADRIKPFFSPALNLDFIEVGDYVKIRLPSDDFRNLHLSQHWSRYAVEGVFSFLVKLFRQLTKEHFRLKKICFDYPAPPYFQEYEKHLYAPCEFECDVSEIIMPIEIYDIDLQGALPMLNQKLAERLSETLQSQKLLGDSTAEQITCVFGKNTSLIGQPLSQTAEYMHCSERTIQRKLKEEGVTFFDLQEREKQRLAKNLLKNRNLTLDQISDQLGFSDRRSFSRAFKRWFQCTLSEYRASM